MTKPFSAACERNQHPILAVLQEHFPTPNFSEPKVSRSAPMNTQNTPPKLKLFEIGSGTGQHAAFFAKHLPHVIWQTSDRAVNLPGIELWIKETQRENLPAPMIFDVSTTPLPQNAYDAVFSSNTAHIMPLSVTLKMMERAAQILNTGGLFLLYGPFKFDGKTTSESNTAFDEWLKAQAPTQGIRDFETLNQHAQQAGLNCIKHYTMPANNEFIIWEKP